MFDARKVDYVRQLQAVRCNGHIQTDASHPMAMKVSSINDMETHESASVRGCCTQLMVETGEIGAAGVMKNEGANLFFYSLQPSCTPAPFAIHASLTDMHIDMRPGMWGSMQMDMQIDMCIDICIYMCTDMCIDMCIDMRIFM